MWKFKIDKIRLKPYVTTLLIYLLYILYLHFAVLTGQCNNSHVNNLLKATSKLVPGWKLKNIEFGQQMKFAMYYRYLCM